MHCTNTKRQISWTSALALLALLTGLSDPAEATPAPSAAFAEPSAGTAIQASIGSDFTITLTFENGGPDPGFAPYIDLFLPTIGADGAPGQSCDGITFVGASAAFASPPSVALDTAAPTGGGTPAVIPDSGFACGGTALSAHPYPGGSLPGLPGYELVVIELPFGSYFDSQGPIVVEVTLSLSGDADALDPLRIYSRGGFRLGDSPLGSLIEEPGVGGSFIEIVPVPFAISKRCILENGAPCPEDETATGPSFAKYYEITTDVDNGLTVESLVVKDCFDDNLLYDSVASITRRVGGVEEPVVNAIVDEPPAGEPGGCLTVTFPDPITGGPEPDDVKVIAKFYVPELHADGRPILEPSCAARVGTNDVSATADWTPLDSRDPPLSSIVSDALEVDHSILKKCLAIQKSVSPATAIPGDTLSYTLSFQVSNYFTLGGLVIVDTLSDGQRYEAGSATLSIDGGSPEPLSDDFIAIDDGLCGPDTPWAFPPHPWPHPPPQIGGGPPMTDSVIEFALSDALADAIGGPGILPGGSVGTLTFEVTVDDAYSCPVPSDEPNVDKHDRVYNYTTIAGDVLDSAEPNPEAPIGSASDDSGAVVEIASDSLRKCVFRIDRNSDGDVLAAPGHCGDPDDPNAPPFDPLARPTVAPGDEVVFRITKRLPSGDWEALTVTDFLPLPIFESSLGNGAALPGSQICPGPASTTYDGDTNSIVFDYEDHGDPDNEPCIIDLLVTATVTTDPHEDGLLFSNETMECEENSLDEGTLFCQFAIADVTLGEPELRITKGVVAACQPDGAGGCENVGTFHDTPVGPVVFYALGSRPPVFEPTIFSGSPSGPAGGLYNLPIESSADVDAGDIVTYAVVVENAGSGPLGAFDVTIRDTPVWPATLLGITDGTGDGFACTPLCEDLFTLNGTTLDDNTIPYPPPAGDPGALDRFDPSSGRNLAVVTYDLEVPKDVVVGRCYPNEAEILRYSGTEDGPDYVEAELGGPFTATTEICVLPDITKSIVSTSEPSTPAGDPMPVTIGEILRFRLEIVLPEGLSPDFEVRDHLPPGLSFLDDGTHSITIAADDPLLFGAGGSGQFEPEVTGGPCGSGADLVFELGTLLNVDGDPDQEIITIEFNALVCNLPATGAGDILPNHAEVLIDIDDDQQPEPVATSNTVEAVVVEPAIGIAKQVVRDPDSPARWIYTLTLTNSGDSTAFDVVLEDLLSSCLVALPEIEVPQGADHQVSNNRLAVEIDQIPAGDSASIVYSVLSDCEPEACPVENEATVTWTSLPGPDGIAPNPPGDSGAVDGERNGSSAFPPNPANSPEPPNDYHAATSANLCGEICVAKQDPDGTLLPGWTIEVSGNPGATLQTTASEAACTEVFVGDYSVSEAADLPNHPGWSPVTPTEQSASVGSDETVTVTFTNELLTGSVTVVKIVTAGPDAPAIDPNVAFPFSLSCDSGLSTSFTLDDGNAYSHSEAGIPAGSVCTLTELQPTGPPVPEGCYWAVSYPDGQVTTIGPGEVTTIEVVNRLLCKTDCCVLCEGECVITFEDGDCLTFSQLCCLLTLLLLAAILVVLILILLVLRRANPKPPSSGSATPEQDSSADRTA